MNANVSKMQDKVADAVALIDKLLEESKSLPEDFVHGCLAEAHFSLEMAESFIAELPKSSGF